MIKDHAKSLQCYASKEIARKPSEHPLEASNLLPEIEFNFVKLTLQETILLPLIFKLDLGTLQRENCSLRCRQSRNASMGCWILTRKI